MELLTLPDFAITVENGPAYPRDHKFNFVPSYGSSGLRLLKISGTLGSSPNRPDSYLTLQDNGNSK